MFRAAEIIETGAGRAVDYHCPALATLMSMGRRQRSEGFAAVENTCRCSGLHEMIKT